MSPFLMNLYDLNFARREHQIAHTGPGDAGVVDDDTPPGHGYSCARTARRCCLWLGASFLVLALVVAFFTYCHYLHFVPLQGHLPPDVPLLEKAGVFFTGRLPAPPPADEAKAAAVREMTRTAWRGYATHALGARALRPLRRKSSDEIVHYSTGLTVLEAMSTLKVVGLEEEYQQARRYVLTELQVPKVGGGGGGRHSQPLYVWPLVTRYIGSLLSCYALNTTDRALLEKAVAFGEVVRPAFESEDRPFNRIDLNFSDASSSSAPNRMGFIGELGAMTLELRYLAALTTNQTIQSDWHSVLEHLRKLVSSSSSNGLYLLTMESAFARQSRLASLSNDAHHFFGYLVRSSKQTAGGDLQAMGMLAEGLAAARRHGVLVENATSGLVTVEDVDYAAHAGEGIMKVGACQLASTLALAGKIRLAEALVESCVKLHLNVPTTAAAGNHSSSNATTTASSIVPHGLPAAEVVFRGTAGRNIDRRGVLSPELAESYFTLWRLTRKPLWRARAWNLVLAINATARVGFGFGEGTGFSEVANVDYEDSRLTDYQPAEFLGATLKYLYLTFSDFGTLPLDRWVFNAVGQPLPVCGTGPAYPKC